eukprot:COSAG04_NODE_435_length_14466_cov_135.545486_16_plen_452_part_00
MAQEIAPGDYVSTTDWSTEYKGGYTPGWGPHVDAGAAAATALAERAAKKYGSIREAFLAVDTNGNGSVEKDELEEVLKLCSLPQETSAALLRQFDENGDEEWSYKEFVKALKRSDYVSYQRGSPSPTKMALAEGGPGHMPARATPVVPQRRGYNLFTGSELQQRESPPLRLSARYPAAVASGRRGRFPTGRSHLPAIPSPSPTRRRSEEPEPEPEPEPQAQPQSLLADGLPPSSVRGASDWSTEYRGGYTPGWGPHVDATAAAATALAQRAEQKFGSIREAFLSVDTNGNGYVERSELEAVSPATPAVPAPPDALGRSYCLRPMIRSGGESELSARARVSRAGAGAVQPAAQHLRLAAARLRRERRRGVVVHRVRTGPQAQGSQRLQARQPVAGQSLAGLDAGGGGAEHCGRHAAKGLARRSGPPPAFSRQPCAAAEPALSSHRLACLFAL